MNTVAIQCPQCHQGLNVPEQYIGKRAKCKRCNFVFVIEPLSLDDSVVSWLGELPPEEPDPAPTLSDVLTSDAPAPPEPVTAPAGGGSRSAMRAEAPAAEAQAESEPESAGPQVAQMPIDLDHVDPLGAFFTFPAGLLYNEDFRSAMPRCCLCCGSMQGLRAHLVIWTSKLPSSDRFGLKEQSHQEIDVEKLRDLEGRDVLNELPMVPHLPGPYNLPIPYFICSQCSPVGAVMTHVRPAKQAELGEICELGISSLKRAADFIAATLGRDHPDYRRLLVEEKLRKDDPWRALPLAVRNRIEQWYKTREDENFITYIHDNDFARTEAGKGGLVLTDKRIVFQKFAAHREVPLTAEVQVLAKPDGDLCRMEFKSKADKPFALRCDLSAVDVVKNVLDQTGTRYTLQQ